MRLSEWRAKAPVKDAGGPKAAAVVDAVLEALGAEPDPHGWVAWGEEPAIRYTIFIPTETGLIQSFVRVIPGEGPRATTKLIRWNRLTIGELTIETQGGHRLLSFQVEQQILRGVDDEADRVAAFAMRVIAGIDGRTIAPNVERSRRSSRGSKSAPPAKPAAKAKAAKPAAARPAPAPRRAGATAAKVRPAKGPRR
jgi:hypothetical protein